MNQVLYETLSAIACDNGMPLAALVDQVAGCSNVTEATDAQCCRLECFSVAYYRAALPLKDGPSPDFERALRAAIEAVTPVPDREDRAIAATRSH